MKYDMWVILHLSLASAALALTNITGIFNATGTMDTTNNTNTTDNGSVLAMFYNANISTVNDATIVNNTATTTETPNIPATGKVTEYYELRKLLLVY